MTRTLMIAAALTLGTTATSFAMGCNSNKNQQAMSCADGTSFDAETQTCVPIASS